MRIHFNKNLAMIALFSTVLFSYLPETICADINTVPTAKSATDKESVERQEKDLKIGQLTQMGNSAYLNKDYPQAKDCYLQAISLATKDTTLTPDTERRLSKLREALSSVYISWANDIISKAEHSAGEGNMDEAQKLAAQAVEIDSRIKPRADDLQNRISQMKLYAKYKDLSSDKKIIPEKEDKSMKIDILYEQGKKLFLQKAYGKAKEKFEEILKLDPYNLSAIEYIKQINTISYELGEMRTSVTEIQRQGQIKWEETVSGKPKVSDGGRVDFAGDAPIKKSDELSDIKKKLNDIIIKNISFEEVPIDTAVLYLKQESKKLDPEGKGVNFFLRLEPIIAEPAAAPAANQQGQQPGWDNEKNAEQKAVEPADQYLITIVLDNVPLGTAIDYICKAAGLKYRINKYAIEIASPNTSFEDLQTQVFPVEREHFDKEIPEIEDKATDLRPFFSQRGVQFPAGTSAVYDTKISRLIVRNSQQEMDKIKVLLSKMEISLPQVSIATKFVEMAQTDFDELGFEWKTSYLTGQGIPSPRPASNGTVNWEGNNSVNRYESTPGVNNGTSTSNEKNDNAFNWSYINGGLSIENTIHALDMNENVEVLSAPEVTTLSGHKAEIKLEEDHSYPTNWTQPTTGSLSSGTNATVNYVIPSTPQISSTDITPTGIMFAVTPYVSSDIYTIDLLLEPTYQAFIGWTDYSYTQTSSTTMIDLDYKVKMPIIAARTIQTQARVFDGETIILGGALTDETKKVDDRVPILGDVPLVGRFFRSQIENQEKTNLLIFTTVKLIKPDGSPIRPQQINGLPDAKNL